MESEETGTFGRNGLEENPEHHHEKKLYDKHDSMICHTICMAAFGCITNKMWIT